jgi:hypothetical protein
VLVISPVVKADGRRARSSRGLVFEARIEGEDRVVVRSHQPLLDACRALVAASLDPETRIVMRHLGSEKDALIAKVGAAAKRRVKEDNGPPRFRTWTPFPSRPAESSMRFPNRATRGVADGDENAPATSPGADGRRRRR